MSTTVWNPPADTVIGFKEVIGERKDNKSKQEREIPHTGEMGGDNNEKVDEDGEPPSILPDIGGASGRTNHYWPAPIPEYELFDNISLSWQDSRYNYNNHFNNNCSSQIGILDRQEFRIPYFCRS